MTFFSRRAAIYKKLISALSSGHKSLSEITNKMKIDRSGAISRYLDDLTLSGFIAKETVYKPGQNKKSRFCKYRLKENYLRFYVKYIEPLKDKIEKGLFEGIALDDLVDWEIIMGFQFENLILNNLKLVCSNLGIRLTNIKSAGYYFQRKTQRQEASNRNRNQTYDRWRR
jgi:hypothetical protein